MCTKRVFVNVAGSLAAVAISACAAADRYAYTIEINAYGPNEIAEAPATVTLTWPGDSRTLSLRGGRAAETVTITVSRPAPRARDLDTIICPQPWFLRVAVAKPGYNPWTSYYCGMDFVEASDGIRRRVDRITLQFAPSETTEEQLQALSLVLPCPLESYTTQLVRDLDGDGSPEALLHRQRKPTASQSPLAEMQVWTLRGGAWQELFVANHRGVFIDRQVVEGSGAAPYGYYNLSPSTDLGPGVTVFARLCPIAKDGQLLASRAKTFVWRKGEPSFVVWIANSELLQK